MFTVELAPVVCDSRPSFAFESSFDAAAAAAATTTTTTVICDYPLVLLLDCFMLVSLLKFSPPWGLRLR